jgi:hypothetical protein
MSMIGNFRAVRDDDIDAMLERPARVVRLLYDEAPVESGDSWVEAAARQKRTSGDRPPPARSSTLTKRGTAFTSC